MKHKKLTYQDLIEKVTGLEAELAKTEWLYEKENVNNREPYIPFYGDVTELNTERTILDTVGKKHLEILTSELMDLLDTSVVIYEKNGDYAYAVFNSGWCQWLDASSRKLCNTDDNKAALNCGKWLCHDDCWKKSAKPAIDSQKSTDIDCIGGIKLYAQPIFAQNEVIGAINIGYGNPPTDDKSLQELSEKYNIDFNNLKQKSTTYNPRPDFIIEIAKKRLISVALLIGEYISRVKAEQALKHSEEKFRSFIENVNDIIYHLTPEGVFTYVSPNWTEQLGYQLDETIGEKVEKFTHPDDLHLCIDFLNKVLSTGKKQSGVEYRVKHKNGTWRWHNSNGAPIKNKKGEIISYIGVGRDITERKIVLEEQNKREALFNNVLSTIPDLVSIHDKNLNIIFSNWNGFGAVGHDKRKFNTKCYNTYRGYNNICPDCQAKTVLETKQFYHSQAQLPDGKWVDLRVFPIFDPIGGNDVFVEWVRDISDIKQSEQILKEKNEEYEALNEELLQTNEELVSAKIKVEENEERFNLAMKASNDGIFDWNLETNDIYYSPSWKKMLGYEDHELTNDFSIWEGLTEPEDVKKSWDLQQKLIKKQIDRFVIEFKMKHKQGHWINVLARAEANFNDNGKAVRIVGTHTDITIRKQMELELAESVERFKALHNASFGGIVIHDKGLIIECNQGLSEITGYTYDELIGMDGLLLIAPDKREMVMGNIIAGYEKPYEAMGIRKNGELYPLRLEARNIPYKGRKVRTVEFRDISERKKAEQQIIAAKEKAEISDRLKTEFLRNMSHEIRTPMNGIIGFSEMLDKPDVNEDKRKYYSKIVQNSSHQLLRIIDDILAISTLETKQEKLHETTFCLNDLLIELFSIFNLKSKEQNIPFYLNKALHDNQSHIISDKTKLNKILGNLLENALKFTNEGFIEFGYYIEKSSLMLFVKDTGIGISPKNHRIIFERFAQEEKEISLKHGGLGLGLSICEENAKLLGGEITLESEKGKGSTFFVSIPYKPVHIANNDTSKTIENTQKTCNNYIILVAEDEEVNFLYVEALFENEIEGNYTLIHAKNGKEAIEICTTNNNIDLVLMDIKMPIMNGHEAAEKIKEKFPDLPIIAQTAYSTESDKQLALKHGCNDFISKPINKEKLFGLINKYLNVC